MNQTEIAKEVKIQILESNDKYRLIFIHKPNEKSIIDLYEQTNMNASEGRRNNGRFVIIIIL